MPSGPSATALTAAESVTIENTISEASATARGVGRERHAGGDQRLGLVPRPVPAGDLVSGRHQPGHDQCAHGAKADKSDVHVALPANSVMPA